MGAPYSAPRIGAIAKSVFTPAYRELLATLRSARADAGLSQRALAHQLGVHASWVAKVELGERRLDVIELARVVEALGRDPVELFAQAVQRRGR